MAGEKKEERGNPEKNDLVERLAVCWNGGGGLPRARGDLKGMSNTRSLAGNIGWVLKKEGLAWDKRGPILYEQKKRTKVPGEGSLGAN